MAQWQFYVTEPDSNGSELDALCRWSVYCMVNLSVVNVCLFYLSSWLVGKRQTLSIGQLPRPTFGDTGSTMSAFFFICFFDFSPVNAVMKQTPVLSFHTTQRAYWEISVKCLSQGHNDVKPSTGIEPANLRSLARRSNQLSYVAVHLRFKLSVSKIYIFILLNYC